LCGEGCYGYEYNKKQDSCTLFAKEITGKGGGNKKRRCFVKQFAAQVGGGVEIRDQSSKMVVLDAPAPTNLNFDATIASIAGGVMGCAAVVLLVGFLVRTRQSNKYALPDMVSNTDDLEYDHDEDWIRW
jgi:hypothetical protein